MNTAPVAGPVRVAVVESTAVLRAGLVSILATAGYAVVPDPGGGRAGAADVLLLCVPADGDIAAAVTAYATREELPIVVVLDRPDLTAYAVALRAGAQAAMALTSDPGALLAAVDAAAAGLSAVPVQIGKALVEAGIDPGLADQDRHWLAELAAGDTIKRIAGRAGYSERSMYRLLAALYERLGVANRSQAVSAAARLGLLGPAAGAAADPPDPR